MTAQPRHSTCRVCESGSLTPVVDLGHQPLANSFLREEQLAAPEPRYPLVFCRCERCGHAQLSITVPPEVMFRHYFYVSGTSETIRAHFKAYANEISADFLPPEKAFVVEIGSNDGTLLRAFDRKRVRVLGVDPATNIAAIAREAGVETINDFFSEELAKRIVSQYGQADAIVGNNVVAHIADLNGLARGIATLLSPRGVFIAEFPYLVDMVERVEYDTIYHEHLSYFSVRSATQLFERAGLALFDVRRVSIHGGSIRIFVARDRLRGPNVDELLGIERHRQYETARPFATFAERVRCQRKELREILDRLREEGRRVAGYGAAAKGNTLLNYCGIGTVDIPFIADKSPLKQGLYTPGGHIPVRPADAIAEYRPDVMLLIAWNFADEILRQQAAYRSAGGRFIVPIPSPQLL